MARYMFLIRGDDETERTEDENRAIVGEYIAWARKLREEGRMLDGDELANTGKVVRRKGDQILVSDGPYAESKEIVGGYFLIRADDEEQAARIAGECPGLKRGGAVEVRPIVEH
jgi:hypothetical protein